MPLFLPISFGTPLILAALLVLPVLWWLLKVTPPLPRRTVFPPLGLLRGLEDEEQTPGCHALVAVAAAPAGSGFADRGPGRSLAGPQSQAGGQWPAGAGGGQWLDGGARLGSTRQELIADLLHSAQGRAVAIIPTAGSVPAGLLNAGEAERIAKELKPMPWPGDRQAAARALGRFNFAAAPALYWLSDGIEDASSKALRDALHRYGGVSIFTPAHLPLGLLPVTRDASGFSLTAIRAGASTAAGD